MVINDPRITQIIKERRTIEIAGNKYYIIANKQGSCDGCYFNQHSDKPYPENNCPMLAVTICCSNGGNILREANSISDSTSE